MDAVKVECLIRDDDTSITETRAEMSFRQPNSTPGVPSGRLALPSLSGLSITDTRSTDTPSGGTLFGDIPDGYDSTVPAHIPDMGFAFDAVESDASDLSVHSED